MSTNPTRSYNCRNEELPVMCKFAAFSMKRDLNDFSTYSHKFNEAYLSAFEAKIATVFELVQPKSETVTLKLLNEQLYAAADGMITPINHLTGYITMANGQMKISAADFGLAALRKGIASKDFENIIRCLQTVNTNIAKYKGILTEQGLKEDLIVRFITSGTSIAADKQKQYEIISNRKNLVQNNTAQFNELFDCLNEILSTGKILYKSSDPAKLSEYTFNELKKRVRRTTKTTEETDEEQAPAADAEAKNE